MQQSLDLGGLVDRSLRQLGQVLVVMGALLGAVLGVALALIVENANTSGAAVASGQEHAALLAAGPPSRPSAPRGADAEGSAAGHSSSGSQPVEAADQADQADRKADKNSERRHDKPGKDKPGKGRDT